MSLPLALLTLLTPAQAGQITLGAGGGRDFPTAQFWTGVEASIHADGDTKWAGTGRLAAAWAFEDEFPMGQIEAGVMHALPHKGEIVRLGLILSAEVVATHYRLPVEFADGERHVGMIPGGELSVEFEFFDEKPFVVGARGGVGSSSSNYLCPTPDQIEECLAWYPAFVGGFFARGKVTNWLYIEGLIGPSPRLAISYPF